MTKPIFTVLFYKSQSNAEPVRDWLKSLPAHERQLIGEDIKAVQFRWPLGMPLVRKLSGKVWEVRTQLPTRIARVLFFVSRTVRWFCYMDLLKRRRQRLLMICGWLKNELIFRRFKCP